MSLKLQAVRDAASDQNFRTIAKQFPIEGGGGEGTAEKDLLANGIGMVIGKSPRLTRFARTWFISAEEPTEIKEYDLWTVP